MKKTFLCYVMILSLLTAVCGCSNGLSPQQETGAEDLEYPDDSTQGTEREAEQGETGKEPDTSIIQGNTELPEDEPTEEAPPIVEPPEAVPPEIEPPIVEPPKGEPPAVEPPETEPPEEEPPITEPPEAVPPEIEPPIVEPPEVKPPVIEPPIVVPPEVEPPETEPPEEEPPIVEPPEVNLLVINELRTEFSITLKRVEYIEFKALAAGNLNGISVHIMSDVDNPFVYNFPAVDVALGEYITLHLRSLENNCIDELGNNLALSGGTDACPTARDLWVAGSNKYLYKTDIVYLQNASGKIIDAVIMNEKPSKTWNKEQSRFAAIAEYLCDMGAWESEDGEAPTPFDAVNTSDIGNSFYKSVCRYEWRANHFNTTDWYVTAANCISPGLANK